MEELVYFSSIFLGLCAVIYYLNHWYRGQVLDDFSTQHVFITGTDTGFGKKLAIELDRKGVTVFAGCYTHSGAEELRKLASSQLRIIRIDVTDQNSINQAKDLIQNDLFPDKGLWGLVNNAGIFGEVFFDFCTVEDYKKVMSVNFFGTISVTEAFVPLIKKSRGRIVTLISVFGRGSVGITPYCCSKFALEPYCDGLRRAMSTFGVHAAIIEPGFFRETCLTNKSVLYEGFQRQWGNLPDTTKTEYGEEFKDSYFKLFELSFSYWPFAKQNRIEMVTNAIQHALCAKNPKSRYRCGYDAWPFILFSNCLPDWILDFVARLTSSYNKVAAKV